MAAHPDKTGHETSLKAVDPIWASLRAEAEYALEKDPILAAFLYSTILNHTSLEDCVVYRICERLDHPDVQAILLRQTFDEMRRVQNKPGTIGNPIGAQHTFATPFPFRLTGLGLACVPLRRDACKQMCTCGSRGPR